MPVIKASSKQAPAPKRGFIRAVYETIDGLGGANEAQIRKYLPAAVTQTNQIATKKQLHQALSNGVGRGYFIHDGKFKMYRIAPISYYNERRRVVRGYKRSDSSKGKAIHMPEFEAPAWVTKQPEFEAPESVFTPPPQQLPIKWLAVAFLLGSVWGFSIGLVTAILA